MKTWPILVTGIVSVFAFLAYTAFLLLMSWPIENWSITKASLFGDSFGVLSSFFTGGAFLLILWTIALQQKELRLQRLEMSRMVDTHRREINLDLIKQAFDDEELAQVWQDDIVDMKEFKQDAYVNFILTSWRMSLDKGLYNKETATHLLNDHMKISRCFRDFWERNSERWKSYSGNHPPLAEFSQLIDSAYNAAKVEMEQAQKKPS